LQVKLKNNRYGWHIHPFLE